MHTEVTYFARAPCRRTKSTVAVSAMAPDTPIAAGHADEVERLAVGKRRRRHQAQAAVAGHGIARLGDDVRLGVGQPVQHLQRPREVELREVGKQHEADVERHRVGCLPPSARWPYPSCRHRLQRLALGDAGDVEALEVPVALVELMPHPHEQVVEGVAAVAQRQALDGLELAPPLALEAGEVVLEEHDGGREDHAPALGQRPLRQDRAVEVGDLARAPEVELQDGEVLAHVVVDVAAAPAPRCAAWCSRGSRAARR